MKIVRVVFGIFFLLGMGCLIGGYFTYRHTQAFIRTAVPVQGVVVENVYRESGRGQDASSSYYPHVRFRTTEGRDIDFVSSTGSTPPSFSVNQTVTVLYDPQRPETASINSFGSLWAAPLVLGILGVVFGGPGAGLLVWMAFSNRKNDWLRQNGQRMQLEITNVELNTSLEVNGRNPYRIVCQWIDPARNEMHVFHSANIWYDPSGLVEGRTMDVLVDPNNLRRYLMDTSFLPKVA